MDMLVTNNNLESQNEALKRENRALERELSILNKQIEILKFFSKNLSDDEKQSRLNDFLIQITEEHIKKYYINSYTILKWN